MLQQSILNFIQNMELTPEIRFRLLVGVLLFSNCCSIITCEEWSYTGSNGPSTWSRNFSKCGGKQQSPINIETKETLFKQFVPLTLNYDKNIAMKMENNGHTVQLSVVDSRDNLTISGGSLPNGSVFRVAHLHFHWGGNDSLGSEHKFDGKSFPLEMQIVHYNRKYADYSGAMGKVDGLVIISVLFEFEKDNADLNVVTQMLKNVSYEGTSMNINSISVKSLLPVEISSFYSYHGSLTTPRCQENVEWIVFKNPATISVKQLESFRQIFQINASVGVQQTKKPLLVNNFRPTQPLNQRSVQRSFDDPPKLFCGRKEPLTVSCTKILRGQVVTFWVQLIKQCLLPAEVSVEMTLPDKGFSWRQSFFAQGKVNAVQIANLNYAVDVELHSHGDGSLHVTVSRRDLLGQTPQSVDVISETFPVDQTCSVNCTSKDFKNCRRMFRSGQDVLDIGFAAKLGNNCDNSECQVHIDLYRKEHSSWMLTGVLVLMDGQTHTGSLKTTIVHNQQSKHQVVDAGMKELKMEPHTFEAEIKKYNKNIYFKLYLVVSEAIKYEVFSKVLFHPSADKSHSGGASGKHVVIGVAVVLILVVLIGGVTYLLYRKRHYFRGHQPALVDEMAGDDSITDNRL